MEGQEAKIALVVLFYNRKKYLEKTMDSLLKAVPVENFPIFLSQDGDEEGMADFVREKYVEPGHAIHLQFHRPQVHHERLASYYYIADHYQFALTKIFDVLKYDTVVLVEDDMLVAPDFFTYFQAMAPVLHKDPSLMCVSAWNDNGMEGLISEDFADELRRTSIFPGLGWMMTRHLWEELREKWPAAFWDDWLREANQTKGRDCVFPTVSRTKTIGEIGSSVGQFYKKYLARIVLNDRYVDWEDVSTKGLDRDVYRQELLDHVAQATTVPGKKRDLRKAMKSAEGDLRTFYTKLDFKSIADALGLMNDLKEGIPRSSFEGIIRLHTKTGFSLFLVPVSFDGVNGIAIP